MSPPPLFSRFFACLLTGIITCAAVATPTGPLIAELVQYSDVRLTIPLATDRTFSRAVSATPDQQAAAQNLLQGARTELSRIINRHLRAVRDDATLLVMQQSEAQVLQDAAAIERQLLTDLEATLTDEQQARFPIFERAHRRTLLRLAPPQPMPIDLWEFFATLDMDPASQPDLAPLLERFDVESDAALVRQRRALLAYYANVRLGFDGSPESRERNDKAQREFFAANANLTRTHARIVEPLIAALAPSAADRLVMAIIAGSVKNFDANLTDPARYPVLREILALDPPGPQRQQVEAIITRATAQALALARQSVIEQARFELLDNERRTDGRTAPINLYLEEASKLRKSSSEEALALLTPQQRRDYDASPVLDPSSTSDISDQ